uniref:ARAD1D16764p n=1 Tax=Blastobotrys adeninivorans TaxID=409370 RepID=A0A060TA66_BLAAD
MSVTPLTPLHQPGPNKTEGYHHSIVMTDHHQHPHQYNPVYYSPKPTQPFQTTPNVGGSQVTMAASIHRVATAPPVGPGSLLPSAFELTPPASHSRKRPYDVANYGYGVPQDVTPAHDATFVAPPPPGPTPQQHKFIHNPNAPHGAHHQLHTPLTDRKGRSASGPTSSATTPVNASASGGEGDVFSDNNELLKSAPVSDHAAYSGYLARQKKDSNDEAGSVWSKDVEEAFMEALRKIPRVGRRKITIQGRPCGRNEIISDYIFKKTGKVRTRKQVSSHIQVLKHLLKDDPEFMSLVADSPPGGASAKVPVVSPIFSKNSAGASEQAARRLEPSSAADMFLTSSPSRRADSVAQGGSPTGPVDPNSLCPANFCMWHAADPARGLPQRIYSQLIRPQFETPLRPKSFDNIAERFPYVAQLLQSGRVMCPLVYGKVKLDIRNDQQSFEADKFHTSLQFHFPLHSRRPNASASGGFNGSPGGVAGRYDHRWEVVTSVSTMTHKVLELREPVVVQENLVSRTEKLYIPFSTEFWAAFIAGFRSKDANSQDAYTAISAITVTQRLYCRGAAALGDEDDDTSDLEAIIIYEFEKAADAFSARTVFRQLILPEMNAGPAQVLSYTPATTSTTNVGGGSGLQSTSGDASGYSGYPPAVSYGSPLTRKSGNHGYGEMLMNHHMPEYASTTLPMARSFSVAEGGLSDVTDITAATTLYPTATPSAPTTSLAENAESLGMVRSMTAFCGTNNPWVGAGFDSTLYGSEWFPSHQSADSYSAAAAAAAASVGAPTTSSEGLSSSSSTNAKKDDSKSGLQVDPVSYSDFEGQSYDNAPLKSAPPTYDYQSFDQDIKRDDEGKEN